MADLSTLSDDELEQMLRARLAPTNAPAPPAPTDYSPQGGVIDTTNLVRGVVRGVPVVGGLLDEANAATNAGGDWLLHQASKLGLPDYSNIPGQSWSDKYTNELANQRGMDKAFDAKNPALSTGLQLAGSVGGTLATLGTGAAATGAAPIVRTFGEKALQGVLTGAGIGGADAFTRGEGGFENRLQDAGRGALVSGAVGAVAPALTTAAGRMFGSRPGMLTGENLRDAAEHYFDMFRQAGVNIRGQSFQNFADQLGNEIDRLGIHPGLHPKASAAMLSALDATNPPVGLMARLRGVVPARGPNPLDVSGADAQRLGQFIRSASASTDAHERNLAGTMQDRLDQYINNLTPNDVVGGNTGNIGHLLTVGRENWAQMRAGERLDQLVENAHLDTAQGGDLGDALAAQFRSLAKNESRMRTFAPNVQDAIRGVAEGTATTKSLGMLSGLSKGSFSNIVGLAGVLTGHPEAMAPKMLGEAAGAGRKALVERQAVSAADLARNPQGLQPRRMDPQTEQFLINLAHSTAPGLNTFLGARAKDGINQ